MPLPLTEEVSVIAYIAVEYAHVPVLGIWAGIARYYQMCRHLGKSCGISSGIMEVLTSVLVGILAFLFFEWMELDRILGAVILTVAAYGGADLLKIADMKLRKKLEEFLKGKK